MIWPDSGFKIGSIPELTWRNLLTRINTEFAHDYDSGRFRDYSVLTFFPKLAASAEMRAYGNELARLFELPVALQCSGGQIALRLPATTIETQGWHIDDVPHPGNGAVDGMPRCEAILGIYLSEVKTTDGALQFYPGSYLQIESFAKERGWNVLRRGVLPKLMGEPQPLFGPPGTAILFHPYTVHRAMANHSSHIRYALYFRYYDKAKP